MTFLDRFKKEHPDHPLNSNGTPYGCPEFYGYESFDDCKVAGASVAYYRTGCKKCWNREVPEEVNPND